MTKPPAERKTIVRWCPMDNGFAPSETESRLAEMCRRSMSCIA